MSKNFKRMGIASFLCMTVFLTAGVAQAVNFDFTTLGADGSLFQPSVTVNGVTATAFEDTGAGFVQSNLWLRNVVNDHGLGVCSSTDGGQGACAVGGGNVNELDNMGSNELIRLDNTPGGQWTELFVSSLDGGGSGNQEIGTISWSNNSDPNAAFAGSFSFSFGDFGALVEGDILTLAQAAGFDKSAAHVFFTAGPNQAGDDNDYLVWKGTIPIPSTLLTFGLGFIAFSTWRKYSEK